MPLTWRNREELAQLAITLTQQGLSRRAIARAAGVSRNTIRALLTAHETQRSTDTGPISTPPRRAPRPSKLDDFKLRIAALMAQFDDITAQRVFEHLREGGFTGSYTAVKNHVRKVRPPPKPTPSLVTPDYLPGEMAESDWSPYEVHYTTGRRAIVQAGAYVLVASKRKAFALYESNDLHALMDQHVRAFNRFHGCAATCKYDSQKPVVLRWEGHQPIYNPRFLVFSSHYEFRPLAVRRAHPNDKPRVERSFWEVERSFLNGREFKDLDDMRAQLEHWLDTVVDQRRLHKRTALERFADERPHLVALPRHPYDTARVRYCVCSIDGFVAWAGNRYAVPYDHVTDILPIRITQRELFVYAADLECIARHELAPRGAGLAVDPAQLHPLPQRHRVRDLEQLGLAFEGMGEHAATFFRLMSQGPSRVWSAQARQILLLRDRYATDDLDRALGHAANFGALDCAAVERIVAARAAPRTLDEYVTEETARRIELTLGQARTMPRDLTEYDRLPACARPARIEETSWPSDPPPTTAHESPTKTSPSSDCDDTSSSSA